MGHRRKTPKNQPSTTTADYLAQAVRDNQPPQHPRTCDVYGFNRAYYPEEKLLLLGLYAGLITKLNISPRTIHDWRIREVLVDEIKAAFHKIPEESRGLYFPWFLQNQHVIALAGQPLSVEEIRDSHNATWRHLWKAIGGNERDPPEEIKAAITRKVIGVEEQMCYALYAILLSGWLPSSKLPIWIEFGFASCTSDEEEGVLYGQYQRLIAMCTFDEFCDAYRNRRILDLFHSKGLQVNDNAHLQNILSGDPESWMNSAWILKKFVLHRPSSGEESTAIIPFIMEYGFINCRNPDDWKQLERVYKDFFTVHHGDPSALFEACAAGNLYGFLSTVIPGLPRKHQRLLTWQHYSVVPRYSPSKSWYSAWQVSPFVSLVFGAVLGGALAMYWMRS